MEKAIQAYREAKERELSEAEKEKRQLIDEVTQKLTLKYYFTPRLSQLNPEVNPELLFYPKNCHNLTRKCLPVDQDPRT